MNNKKRLERLLQEVDRIVNEDMELKGFILLTINEVEETDLVFYGESQEILIKALNDISDNMDGELDDGSEDQ